MTTNPSDLNLVGSANEGMAAGRAFGQAILFVFQLVSRPLILLTRALTRRSFGERYFTMTQVVCAIALVATATLVTTTAGPWKPLSSIVLEGSSPSSNSPYFSSSKSTQAAAWAAPRSLPLYVGGAWGVLLLAAAVEQNMIVGRRYRDKRRWHSFSPGIPRAGNFGALLESTLALIVAGALGWFGQYPFAGLVLLSIALGVVEDGASRKALWNKILDVIDAQIEGENLQKAVEANVGPAETEGFTTAFPARARGVFGEAVARGTLKPAAALEAKPETKPVSA